LPEAYQRRSLSGGQREGGREGGIPQVATKERLSEAKPLWRPEGGRDRGKEGGLEGGREGGR